jgi:2-polyprenyl-3-methyl-5-hydroxy-6-metoxy-1,4-benzoquinol methylase
MRRNCEICGSSRNSRIYTPVFYLPGRTRPFKYDAVVCKRCGFLFADNIPSQKEYDIFYKQNAKYVYTGNIPAGLDKIYREIFSRGKSFLNQYYGPSGKKIKVLDIGCSVGHILNLFKGAGFKDILGIEPAWRCRAQAKKLFGIRVINRPLAEFKSNKQFGLIIMTGVLEHVRSLKTMLPKAADLLAPEGVLMVVVPDADKFNKNPEAPFEEFSLEHINYFNKNSLNNLMGNYHLKNIYTGSINAEFYNSKCLLCFFKKEKRVYKIKKDPRGYLALDSYVRASKNKLKLLETRIDALLRHLPEVVVWGAGSLASRLLASTKLAKTNIRFFVDSNKYLQGKKLLSFRIYPPDYLSRLNKDSQVLILSNVYAQEMRKALTDKYHFKGNIVQL